jgi:transglutaminase-like putative cysteine protease
LLKSVAAIRSRGKVFGTGLPGVLVWSVWIAMAGVMLLFPLPAVGQLAAATFKTGIPPDWVERSDAGPKPAIAADQAAGGQVFALFDTQVNAAKGESYLHVVKQITDPSGVQNGSNLEFLWDPSFQELTIHQVTVERGTNRMNRLDPAKFKVIQQETDLNRHIYNGTLSAVLFLDDVRVGDRIEYSYTVRGANPSLQGLYSDAFSLGWVVPVERRRIRLLWPNERSLHFRVHGNRAEPKVQERDGVAEYVWDLRGLPAVTAEDQIPSWLVIYPWIQVSEFASWAEVANWATGLYVSTNLDAPELKEAVAQLRRPNESAEQTVQRALDFAQNEIRYLGIEFGPHSYHPTDPVTVLRRRFGDCKDKVFVLCTLLRGLGYEATPVLVGTGLRHTLPDFIPAPHVFNHVIVRVVAEGFTYWLDPTRSHQHGPIRQRYLPDFGFGLLVQAGRKGLNGDPHLRATSARNPDQRGLPDRR